jgi:hypothetical protein
MKKEGNDLIGLFHDRLAQSRCDVRPGFWEEIARDVTASPSTSGRLLQTPLRRRIAVAAAAMLLLGMTSALYWYLTPRTEMNTTFSEVEPTIPWVQPPLPAVPLQEIRPFAGHHATAPADFHRQPAVALHTASTGARPASLESSSSHSHHEEHVSVHVSVRLSAVPVEDEPVAATEQPEPRLSKWAVKGGIGSSLPQGKEQVPLTASLSVERRLNKTFALEAGLQYSYLPVKQASAHHSLAVPLRVHATLASSNRFDFYLLAGGMLSKSIASGQGEESVQLAAQAGAGVRYRLSDRLALFAEPTVSHAFDRSASHHSGDERSTNLNLLCGIRMTY